MLNSTTSRLASFAAALAFLSGSAAAVGSLTHAAPPFQDCLKVAVADDGMAGGMAPSGQGERMVETVKGADGLHSTLAGLRLVPVPQAFHAGDTASWHFSIKDCNGNPVHKFDRDNTKLLHLIVVRSDLTAYQHLHPTLAADGTWTVTLGTPRAGKYRAIADFVVDGRKYVLGTTIVVPGDAPDRSLAPERLNATVDGYSVELQRPAVLQAGAEDQLTFRINRRGTPVTDLQPYLGSFGHLVALHAPDLAYSHVHPNGVDRTQGAITFDTELLAHGAYRLFLQFQTNGRVHTVAFTQNVS